MIIPHYDTTNNKIQYKNYWCDPNRKKQFSLKSNKLNNKLKYKSTSQTKSNHQQKIKSSNFPTYNKKKDILKGIMTTFGYNLFK